MTPEIAQVFLILAAAIFFLVTEWIPLEVTALLALGSVALTGLISATDALSGFSNPAVVTVWAVFILSGGLTRTGVANVIGRWILKLAGKREVSIMVVIMLSSGIMSAVMNNVAVVALLLPVVMDICRQTGHAPSRLLMPLAYGSLLGGLTTMIGTPPNILVSELLRENGLTPFRLFDYTPIGGLIMLIGIAFMVLIGRHLLPKRDVARETASGPGPNLRDQYDLRERMFVMRIPPASMLVGKTLAESRMGSALDLTVLGIIREGRNRRAPGPSEVLQAGDCLLIEGRLERMNELKKWCQLIIEEPQVGAGRLLSEGISFAEVSVAPGSVFTGKTIYEIGFRNRFDAHVVAIRRNRRMIKRTNLQHHLLRARDILLVHGPDEKLEALGAEAGFQQIKPVSEADIMEHYHLTERLMLMRVPDVSILLGQSLRESRLGDALSMRVLSIFRRDHTVSIPGPDDRLMGGDRLIILGKLDDFNILQGLEELEIDQEIIPDMIDQMETDQVGLVEVMLSPHTRLAGMTLRQLHFREKYGMRALAIWREGKAYRTNLRDMPLRFGDAMLMYGDRTRTSRLGQEPDFLVLTQAAQEAPRLEKAKVSMLVMAGVLLPVLFGLVPIYIAAVVGAAFMVLTRCLTMEEAYRAIEWKAVFLIAGLLPLGTALDQTQAAKLIADGVVTLAGPFGPLAVMLGILVLTFLGSFIIPAAARVVLMAPIVLSAAADMGVSPHTMMMAMAMAASASFMAPISHPANVLVMGPGGYRFIDFLKIGGPLSLVILIVVLLFTPIFWPF